MISDQAAQGVTLTRTRIYNTAVALSERDLRFKRFHVGWTRSVEIKNSVKISVIIIIRPNEMKKNKQNNNYYIITT